MSYNSKYSGQQVENLLDQVASGNVGGGDSSSTEQEVVYIKVDDIYSEEPIQITLEDYDNMLNKNVVIVSYNGLWFEENKSGGDSEFSITLWHKSDNQLVEADFIVRKQTDYAEILQGEYWKSYDLDLITSNYWQEECGTEGGEYEIMPNTFYKWDEVDSLSITFGVPDYGGATNEEFVAKEYLFQFTSGATPTALTLPDSIKWANDTPPTIAENMIYQISIVNGLAVCLEFSNEKQEIIEFFIEGERFEAISGMKWAEWCESDYNPVRQFEINGEIGEERYVYYEFPHYLQCLVVYEGSLEFCDIMEQVGSSIYVSPDREIIAGNDYGIYKWWES